MEEMTIYDSRIKCSGCTACVAVCPQKCIQMHPDEEGFLYPHVDLEKCIKCNRCKDVCPVKRPCIPESWQRKTYVACSKNVKNRIESTSGGMFYPIQEWVLENNGFVFAASFSDEFRVEHKMYSNTDANDTCISKFRGSKYVQSFLGDCFVRIRDILCRGGLVCFIGTPCQINGLKSYLGETKHNLITVDVVCHGVASPKLWGKYLEYQTKKYAESF